MIKKVSFILLMCVGFFTQGVMAEVSTEPDWRNTGHPSEQMKQLIKVIPSASNIMIEMGERLKNLYWAAKLEKWEFAAYQAEEMEELIRVLQISRPARAASAQVFLNTMFPAIHNTIAEHNWVRFQKGFDDLRKACMTCHVTNDHAFVILPIPKSASSPVLNLE